MRRSLLVVVAACSSFACGASPDASTDQPSQDTSASTATTYLAIGDFWKTSAEQDAWTAAVANVKAQFDDICGDTFCGSDYSNFEPLELDCAVSSIRGSVKGCTWVFAASEAVVGPTGAVAVSAPHYLCSFNPTGNATALAAALGASGSLQGAPLPGLTQTLYDVVGECLQNPIGATAVGAPTVGTYEDASEADGVDQGAWFDMTGSLANSFANVCGDTFCEGDYSNLTSFGFACSIGTTSKKIHECRWVIGGSYSTVAANTGVVTVNEKSSVCVVAAHGTADDLISTLGSPGTVEPVMRPLPGETFSAYDELAKCLK